MEKLPPYRCSATPQEHSFLRAGGKGRMQHQLGEYADGNYALKRQSVLLAIKAALVFSRGLMNVSKSVYSQLFLFSSTWFAPQLRFWGMPAAGF